MKKMYFFILLSIITATSFAQIELVKDINPGEGSSYPQNLFVFNDTIYLSAQDTDADVDHGSELWKSDGTEDGTVLVKDIKPGTGDSYLGYFFEFNSELFFSADEVSESELWKTDGTESGTVKVLPEMNVTEPVKIGNLVYFIKPLVNSVNSNSLYQFDGITAEPVANVGNSIEHVFGSYYIAFNDKLYLYMQYEVDYPTIGSELYVYDPAFDTFTLVKDCIEGSDNGSMSNFTVLGSKFYFEAGSGGLWVSDGTTEGTDSVQSAQDAGISGVRSLFVWNGLLYFEGDDGTGDQLWVHDPVGGSVTNISNLSGTNANHDPMDFCAAGNYLYYRGEDSNDTDGHLFRTNGTTIEQIDASFTQVDEINYINGVLYFEAKDNTGDGTGYELFKYNLRKSVEFTVTDGTNPIEGATVTLTGYDAVLTNSEGIATAINVIPEEDINYTISKTGYDDFNGTITVQDENVNEAASLVLSTYDVTFTVTDGTSVLEGAIITLTGYDAVTTNASGIATVSGVIPASNLPYTATIAGYDDVIRTVTITDANVNEDIIFGLTTYDVIFTVTDGTNVLENAIVTIAGYIPQTTNASGIAIISDVAVAEDLAYTVTSTGYNNFNGTVTVTDANVDEAVTLVLITFDVTFTITDGTSALEGATVALTGYTAATTNASGIATVENVIPVEVTV